MATVDDLLKVAAKGAQTQAAQREAAKAVSVAVGNQRPPAPQPAPGSGNSAPAVP